MADELKRVEKVGTYPALARWADRWQVKFSGTGGYEQCLRQAWAEVERRQRPANAARAAKVNN